MFCVCGGCTEEVSILILHQTEGFDIFVPVWFSGLKPGLDSPMNFQSPLKAEISFHPTPPR